MTARWSPQSIGDAVVRDLIEAGLVSHALSHTAHAVARAAVATHLLETEAGTDPAPPPVPTRCDEDDCG